MGRKILYEHIDKPGIETFDVYRKNGGYKSVEKVLKEGMKPMDIVEEVKASGLKGRGGAGFPTGLKWSFLDRKSDNPHYLVCNADESEPGTFKDRHLISHIPHILIEGMIVSSIALEAHTSYIYIRGEMMHQYHILEKAIQEAYDAGFLGQNILGTDYSLDIFVHPGAGAYICGEETGLLESLEGKRGNPRIKPPFPAVEGLYRCPTVVNNVESIANVPFIINHGAEEFASIGTEQSHGTKLISACGHIKNPGVYEIELGLPVEEFIYSEEYCGGIPNGKELKAVIAGGASVPILPKELILKTAEGKPRLMSYESLSEGGFETGTMMGSGGFIVMDETTCIVKNLATFSHFFAHESCGQCSPCREGTGWLDKILERLEKGEGRMKDVDLIVRLADNMEGKTICPLADAAAWPVQSSVRHFREEFEYHVIHADKVKDPKHFEKEPFIPKGKASFAKPE